MRASSKFQLFIVALLSCACNPSGGGAGSVSRQDAPGRFAATICDLQVSCDCELATGSVEACIDENTQELETALMEAESEGLIYDPTCMASLLDAYEHQIGCKTITELIEDSTFTDTTGSNCKIVYGTVAEGQPCTYASSAFGDNCMQGLFCSEVCVSSPTTSVKQLGEVCSPDSELCEDGSVCTNSPDAPETFTCKDRPGLGESCMALPLCEVGLGCDPLDSVCKGPVGAGEDCTALPCQDEFYCTGTCVPTLAEGEACDYSGQCGAGFECDLAVDGSADVCTPEQPLICP